MIRLLHIVSYYVRKNLFIKKEHLEFLSWFKDRFGWFQTVLELLRILKNKGSCYVPDLHGKFSILVRPNTTDQDVYDEIFIEKKYDIEVENPKVIVDAGAHIGLASVFFSYKYPEAKIIAIEPELNNFMVLEKNVQNYKNIIKLNAGLWSKKTFLSIMAKDVSTWSFRVIEEPFRKEIPAIGITNIIYDYSVAKIDILKMDIEGSEVAVFSNSTEWISFVKTLIIELHDRYLPGCSEALFNAFKDYEYLQHKKAECLILTNINHKQEHIK